MSNRDAPTELEPRRQARGERRMETLLATAERLFVQHGYDKVTTNLIATEAGASPGTLYQFFANKEAIANALARRYVAQLDSIHSRVFRDQPPSGTAEFVDAVVDPFLEFHLQAPAFWILFLGTSVHPDLVDQWQVLRRSATDHVVALLKPRVGPRSDRELAVIAGVVLGVFRGILPLIEASPEARGPLIAEMKQLFRRYLEPLFATPLSPSNPGRDS